MAKKKLADFYYKEYTSMKRVADIHDDELFVPVRIFHADGLTDDFIRQELPEFSSGYMMEGMHMAGYVMKKDLPAFRKKCGNLGIQVDADRYVYYTSELPDGRLYASRATRLYPTKMTADDLPASYLEVTNYKKHGYVRTDGVIKVVYKPSCFNNHAFKDDFIFIFYEGNASADDADNMDFSAVSDACDVFIFGNDIIFVVNAIARFSPGCDLSSIKKGMVNKYNAYVKEMQTHDCMGHDWEDEHIATFEELLR